MTLAQIVLLVRAENAVTSGATAPRGPERGTAADLLMFARMAG